MNSDAKGTTPATLTGIVPGTYTVLLKKSGYPDYTTSTAIIAGQVTTINADLTKGPQAAATNAPAATATTAPVPGEGSLSVSTTPQGAQVFIDGVVRGMTPATIPGLSAGQHTVLLKTGRVPGVQHHRVHTRWQDRGVQHGPCKNAEVAGICRDTCCAGNRRDLPVPEEKGLTGIAILFLKSTSALCVMKRPVASRRTLMRSSPPRGSDEPRGNRRFTA